MTRIIIARICCCFCLLLLLLCRSALAGPTVESYSRAANGRQRAPRDYYDETASSLGYLASKAMGAFVRVASFMFQWMPNFWRPPKSSLRFHKNDNYYRSRDDDYDFFDADAYR